MRRWILFPVLATGLLLLGDLAVAGPNTQVCSKIDEDTKEVLPGVTLTWDSAFLCDDAPAEGRYRIDVRVANHAGSDEAVRLNDIVLSHTTPRPRGQGPDATAGTNDLPIVVGPGDAASFTVKGDYELVSTDEGEKANLHLRLNGVGTESGDPFRLGINVHIRAPGVAL